jgi:hypothetical protein
MEGASTSETSVNFYQTTRRYNPEHSHLHVDAGLVGSNAVWTWYLPTTFQKDVLSQSSGLKTQVVRFSKTLVYPPTSPQDVTTQQIDIDREPNKSR